jgi:hypothetical protein
MSWYKVAKDFTERNNINEKIRYLDALRQQLQRLAKLVYQSGKTTKQASMSIIESKKITSYPSLHHVLMEAHQLILDSPKRYAEMCMRATELINDQIELLKKRRTEITFGENRPRKGWD